MTPVHWETVTPQLRTLLSELGQQPWMSRFYLAGGTALALRVGHRRSIDLDFFSADDPIDETSRRRIRTALATHAPEAVEDVDGNLLLRIGDALHVAFLSYGYPLMSPTDRVEQVAVASLRDIGLMKLDAVIGRGSRKDFIDLYYVARQIPLDALLEQSRVKYRHARDFPLMAVESFLRFDNADRDRQPEMLDDLAWAEVRAFFVAESRRHGGAWFGPDRADEPDP